MAEARAKAGFKLAAVNQPFESTRHEKFRCNRHGQLMADTPLPASRPEAAARRPKPFGERPPSPSDLGLLRDLQGIIDLDAKVPDCRLKLGMA